MLDISKSGVQRYYLIFTSKLQLIHVSLDGGGYRGVKAGNYLFLLCVCVCVCVCVYVCVCVCMCACVCVCVFVCVWKIIV